MIRLIVLWLVAMSLLASFKTAAVTVSCERPFWQGFMVAFGEVCPQLRDRIRERAA